MKNIFVIENSILMDYNRVRTTFPEVFHMIQATSKITGKGQVQLPVEIRKIIGGETGDTVVFTVQDDGKVVIEVIKKQKLSELGGVLKSSVAFTDVQHEEKSTKEIWVNKRVKGTQ